MISFPLETLIMLKQTVKDNLIVLLLGSGVKRHVGKKACLFKSRGVKRHVVKSQSVNWHAVFRQSMKKGMFPLGLARVDNIFS